MFFSPSQTNTFQAVLATDGERSFAFFIYIDMQWGMGGVGFDAGDDMRSFTLPGSRTSAASATIESGSNIGINGVYAYRIDFQSIVNPGGESNLYLWHSSPTIQGG